MPKPFNEDVVRDIIRFSIIPTVIIPAIVPALESALVQLAPAILAQAAAAIGSTPDADATQAYCQPIFLYFGWLG